MRKSILPLFSLTKEDLNFKWSKFFHFSTSFQTHTQTHTRSFSHTLSLSVSLSLCLSLSLSLFLTILHTQLVVRWTKNVLNEREKDRQTKLWDVSLILFLSFPPHKIDFQSFPWIQILFSKNSPSLSITHTHTHTHPSSPISGFVSDFNAKDNRCGYAIQN